MAWDDDKATATDPDNPTPDEQLTADEWDQHVLEGHFPSDELNFGTDGSGNPVVTDPQNADQVVATYNRATGSWEFGSINTEQVTTPTSTDPNNPTIWRKSSGDDTIENREVNGVSITGDNTAQSLISVKNGSLSLVYGFDGSGNGFSDIIHRMRGNLTVINGEGVTTRSYSVSAGVLEIAIDDSGTTWTLSATDRGISE